MVPARSLAAVWPYDPEAYGLHRLDKAARKHEENYLGCSARKQGARKQGLGLDASRHGLDLVARRQGLCLDARRQSLCLDARKQSLRLDARRQSLEWGIAVERHAELALGTPEHLSSCARMPHARLRRAGAPLCGRV